MTYQWFLVGTALVLLGHAWMVGYAGLRLAGKALLFVLGMGLFVSTLWYGIAGLAPPGSLKHALIIGPIFVCIEDLTRTWFVVSRVRKAVPLAASSVAFAAVASFVEIVVQISDLIVAAGSMALGFPVSGDAEFFDSFFSSYSAPLSSLALDALRPGIQYLLCVTLYFSWNRCSWLVYLALVTSHVAVDMTIELLSYSNPMNYLAPSLGIAILFGLFLCAAALWISNQRQPALR
jgi:hypothetical protein